VVVVVVVVVVVEVVEVVEVEVVVVVVVVVVEVVVLVVALLMPHTCASWCAISFSWRHHISHGVTSWSSEVRGRLLGPWTANSELGPSREPMWVKGRRGGRQPAE
jgi:hypothetical protein